jgi:TolB-like protein/DNA-binding winged helix-turn-helix (wHTH) protein
MLKAVDERWQVGDLTIDVARMTVLRHDDPIILPPLSFRLLLALVRSAPRILSVDELMAQVWAGVFVNPETVTQRAKLLRDALRDDPRQPRYFTVRRGVGYQLIPTPVRLHSEAAARAPAPGGRQRLAFAAATFIALLPVVGPSSPSPPPVRAAHHAASVRVAVLPFDNLSRDPADAFMARSIPEMVLDRLSSVDGLTVIARDSGLLSAAATAPASEAAQQLRADFFVKGSVQRVGETLRVTCFLVDARRSARIWSEHFDWPVDRIYALQDHIAEGVATSLVDHARALGPLPAQASATQNSEAYLAYLKGKSLLRRFTVAETEAAAAQFEQAVRLDPGFADAKVALFDARMQGAELRKEDLAAPRARYGPLLDDALRLSPASGPALFAQAMWAAQPFETRLQLFRRAAQLDPRNSRGLTADAEFLDKRGTDAIRGARSYAPEAQALIERVLAIDPLSPRARWWLVQRRWTDLPPEEFERQMGAALALDPDNYALAVRYAMARWCVHGETAEAIARTERMIASDPRQPSGPNLALALYLDAGDPASASAVAASTPTTREASGVLLAQYRGDWRAAGSAALAARRFPFNVYQSWGWAEAVRDYALRTGEYQRAAEAIAARYGFDLENPRTSGPPQVNSAPALAQILAAKGERAKATRLLAQTVQWIDTHPGYGMAFHLRARAEAMMLLGDEDEALSNLQAAFVTGHDVRHWWYVVDRDPVWTPVRSDPRFRAIAGICREAARLQHGRLEALRREGRAPARPHAA